MDPSDAVHHHHHHQQEMDSQTLESMLVCPKPQQEKKPRPQPEQALKCPRCESTNTKFCYYNNYSLSQPRYFCKSCRRYWTKGGTLRNVPVGGGCRKNKRSSSSSSSSASKRAPDQPLITPNPTPLISYHHPNSDLTLALARLHKQATGQLGFDDHDHLPMTTHFDAINGNPSLSTSNTPPAFLDGLKSSFFEDPSGFHNMYYEMGEGNMGVNVDNVGGMGINSGHEMGMGCEDHMSGNGAATMGMGMKQEMCSGREAETRVLWGLPWQIGGDGLMNMMGDIDSGRESWNGIASSWHGLLNSPLM